MPQIKEILVSSNPWWKEEFGSGFKDREVYKDIEKYMPLPQIIAITGLRRVGKTSLMYKMVEDGIAQSTDPKNVVYFPFDEAIAGDIRQVLKEYEELMGVDIGKGHYLLLLDEIQKLDGWENQLKAVYDRYKGSLKIIISGSESLFIRKMSKETLAGRIFEFKVDTLSFSEFVSFRSFNPKPVGLHEKELKKLFDEFSRSMGFPELVDVTDRAIIRKYVRESIIDKIMYKDIPGLFKVEDPAILDSLLNIISEDPGQIIELNSLATELKVSRHTIASYLSYLERSFLIRKLYNYSTNRRKVERKLKRYYPAMISVDLLFRDDDHSKSRVFEWQMVTQLKAEFFWRDPSKNEVDIVMPGNPPVPIEVKYGKLDTSGLSAFMRKFNVGKGYIISREKEESITVDGKKVTAVPAFKFLLDTHKARLTLRK